MATGLLLDTVSLPMQSVHGYRTEAYSIGFLERIKRILLSHEVPQRCAENEAVPLP